VKDGGRPEEELEAQRDKEEEDTEAGDNLPYVIKTSDVMGRLVTSRRILCAMWKIKQKNQSSSFII
jgi:hypothetical protein